MTMIVGSTSLARFVAAGIAFLAGAVVLGASLKLWRIGFWVQACS